MGAFTAKWLYKDHPKPVIRGVRYLSLPVKNPTQLRQDDEGDQEMHAKFTEQYAIYTARTNAVSVGGGSMQAASSYGSVSGRANRQGDATSSASSGIPPGTVLTQTERVRTLHFGGPDDTPQKVQLRQGISELEHSIAIKLLPLP